MKVHAHGDPCFIARAAELSAATDPNRSADLLEQLAADLRARAASNTNAEAFPRVSLVELAALTDCLGRRLRGGRVKSVSGLERRVRILMLAVDGAESDQPIRSS